MDKRRTYHSSQITLELLDDHGETPTCLIEEVPAFLHCRLIISRSNEFLWLGDVPRGIPPDFVVHHRPELGLFLSPAGKGEEEIGGRE